MGKVFVLVLTLEQVLVVRTDLGMSPGKIAAQYALPGIVYFMNN